MASRLQAVGELQAQLDISLLFWAQTEKLLGAPGLPTFGCEFLAFTFPHGRTPSGADGKSQVLLWASLQISWQRPPQSRSHQRRCDISLASGPTRSEEHTSELQSPCNIVFRLLLEEI